MGLYSPINLSIMALFCILFILQWPPRATKSGYLIAPYLDLLEPGAQQGSPYVLGSCYARQCARTQ